MALLAAYRLSDRKVQPRLRRVRHLGLLPLWVVGLLMYVQAPQISPVMWSVLGLTLGLQCSFWGACRLWPEYEQHSALGRWLTRHADGWFPLLLFTLPYLYVGLAVAVLWNVVRTLGFPLNQGLTLLAAVLYALVIAKAICEEAVRTYHTDGVAVLRNLLQLTLVALGTALGTELVSLLLLPPTQHNIEAVDPYSLLLWVPAVLTTLTCLVLAADQLTRYVRLLVKPAD